MENKELIEQINKQIESLWQAINILKREIENISKSKIPAPSRPDE